MVVVERWWNGLWGRLTRADIRLQHDGDTWYVSLREGNGDVNWHRWRTPDEAVARDWLEHLFETSVYDRKRWRRIDAGVLGDDAEN